MSSHFYFSSKVNITEILTISSLILLLIWCTGCSNVTPQNPAPSTPTSSISSQSGNAEPTVVTVPNLLQVRSSSEVGCSPDDLGIMPGALVLTTNRLQYDTGEIQQMVNYLEAVFHNNPQNQVPPNTLQLIPGSILQDVPAWTMRKGNVGCSGTLEITNISQNPIQLSNIIVQLAADSQQNTYQYRLIDVCSLPSDVPKQPPTCPVWSQGTASETPYDFHLNAGKSGTVFQRQLRDQTDIGITIQPGDIFIAHLNFTSASKSGNFIYSVVPKLIVSVSGEQRTIALTDLKSMLAFIDPHQLSCYQLQENRNTFVALAQKTISAAEEATNHVWCL